MDAVNKNRVDYKTGYNWVLAKPSLFETGITGFGCANQFVSIYPDGTMLLQQDYAIDGITGVTGYPWEKLIARPWLRNNCWPHDGFYQLMRTGKLPITLKAKVDVSFMNGCLRDGAYYWQALLAYKMVSNFGTIGDEEQTHPVYSAP